ncbi:MAG: hypothetical protein KDD50_09835 [Bdellovibrionales bacterium]|nr:hypothetical protein [Bdellovibrionales bacterium]
MSTTLSVGPIHSIHAASLPEHEILQWLDSQGVTLEKNRNRITIRFTDKHNIISFESLSLDLNDPTTSSQLEEIKQQLIQSQKLNSELKIETTNAQKFSNLEAETILQNFTPDIKTHPSYEAYLKEDFPTQLETEPLWSQFLNNHTRSILTIFRFTVSGIPTFFSFYLSDQYSLEASATLGFISGLLSGIIQFKSELYLDFLAKKINFKFPSKLAELKTAFSFSSHKVSSSLAAHTKWFMSEVIFMGALQASAIALGNQSVSPFTATLVVLTGALLTTFQQGTVENVNSFFYNRKKHRMHADFVKKSASSLRDSFLAAAKRFNDFQKEFEQSPPPVQEILRPELFNLIEERNTKLLELLENTSSEDFYGLNRAHRKPELHSQLTLAMISFVSMGLISSLMTTTPFLSEKLVEFSNPFYDFLKSSGANPDITLTNAHGIMSLIGASGLFYYYRLKTNDKKEKLKALSCTKSFVF